MNKIRIIEENGKWEPTTFLIDPDKLNPKSIVDKAIIDKLKQIRKRKKPPTEIHLTIDIPYNEDTDGEFFEVSKEAKQESDELVIWTHITYGEYL